ncbi:Xaa-Pro aminopeptidase [Aliidiomarina soli]|uniref:Xaa-Pro aminopeptidase n=1 Tax=Aliidiomarina soli TaxID=1928574 RepID=UPI0018E4EF72|nr:Xaa-Pro aminopeptidase [Aliidiomarina soli]
MVKDAIAVEELKQRRQALAACYAPGTVLLIRGGRLVTRSNDTEYPFRQRSDFFYLTGLNEPDGWLVLVSGEPLDEFLFVLPRDSEQEIWHGRRLGCDKAAELSGITKVRELNELNRKVLSLLGSHDAVAWCYQVDSDERQQRQRWLDKLSESRKHGCPSQIHDLAPAIHELRLFKSKAEINLMRRSAQIAADAHRRAMSMCKVGRYEYQLAAEIHHEFAMRGTAGPAYGTICGSGDNACILHYTENESQLKNGDLVLIDAGCEYQGYASDITRTFPVNGRFSPAQKRLYNWVLKAQQAAIAQIKPGVTLPQLYKVAAKILSEGLIDVGVLKGSVAENIKGIHYRPYFMHGLGHWLGLDVHDVGAYKIDGEPRPLEPGMVLTIEPGLYIDSATECPPEYRGLGIRIEDDILVTEDGCENLTASVPVTVEEIEDLMTPGAFT